MEAAIEDAIEAALYDKQTAAGALAQAQAALVERVGKH